MPGLDRQRPHHIEIKLTLEPKSSYSIFFKCDLAYLKWDEYPPDVNHGFYINPALVTIKLDKNSNIWNLEDSYITINEEYGKIFFSKPKIRINRI